MNQRLLRTTSKWIAAGAGLCLGLSAQAQSNVTLYGIVDAGLQITNSPNGNFARLQSGLQSGSRWGLRGNEDLGSGLKAIFTLESSFAADTGAGGTALFDRRSTLGLAGAFGGVEFGRRDVPLYELLSSAEPFGKGTSLGMNGILSQGGRGYTRRVNNQIRYDSAVFGGFNAQLMYSLGESNASAGTKKSLNDVRAASLIYTDKTLYAGYAYNRSDDAASAASAAVGAIVNDVTPHTIQALAASYDLQIVKLYGVIYGDKRNATPALATSPAIGAVGQIDQRIYWLGISAPFDASTIAFQYGKVKDKVARLTGPADARQFTLAYLYSLSKRTNLYASYGNVRNDHYLAATGGFSVNATGLYDAMGRSKVWNTGIRHLF